MRRTAEPVMEFLPPCQVDPRREITSSSLECWNHNTTNSLRQTLPNIGAIRLLPHFCDSATVWCVWRTPEAALPVRLKAYITIRGEPTLRRDPTGAGSCGGSYPRQAWKALSR